MSAKNVMAFGPDATIGANDGRGDPACFQVYSMRPAISRSLRPARRFRITVMSPSPLISAALRSAAISYGSFTSRWLRTSGVTFLKVVPGKRRMIEAVIWALTDRGASSPGGA